METILVVDDERSVRQTFLGWLREASLGCALLEAGDAASALALADRQPIDLAILDWNLGSGMDGLRLLEDLVVFNPDVVAIMVTGYAHRATPLMAMRLGVRDYLDKNQDLNREAFLGAVTRQLERIRPARREKRINQGLAAFSDAVGRVLPLVQAAAALNDPVPVGDSVKALGRFAAAATGATDGVLLVRAYDGQERQAAYALDGSRLGEDLLPWASSMASAAAGMGEPVAVDAPGDPAQPFERGRQSILFLPMDVAPGVQAVLELFGPSFGKPQRAIGREIAALGEALLRQALAHRADSRMLADALAQAQAIGAQVGGADPGPALRAAVQSSLEGNPAAALTPDGTVRLAEAIRALAVRHGEPAVEHCLRLVESLAALLDTATGAAP
ncbi:MAG: response regulator [Gemmataceae bacterium]|nr:response regulator [Gemmataceae bacterium]